MSPMENTYDSVILDDEFNEEVGGYA